MRNLLCLLLFAFSIFSCENKEFLGRKDVELSATSNKEGLIVEYRNEDGNIVSEEVQDNGFYLRMSDPGELILKVTATKENQRIVARISKDRVNIDYSDVTGNYHTVKLKE